jgi:mRNA-degrading endonuclease YafQ of YafQ-DinJ toxin-antitoxin module
MHSEKAKKLKKIVRLDEFTIIHDVLPKKFRDHDLVGNWKG